jgi:hypothetical protein
MYKVGMIKGDVIPRLAFRVYITVFQNLPEDVTPVPKHVGV